MWNVHVFHRSSKAFERRSAWFHNRRIHISECSLAKTVMMMFLTLKSLSVRELVVVLDGEVAVQVFPSSQHRTSCSPGCHSSLQGLVKECVLARRCPSSLQGHVKESVLDRRCQQDIFRFWKHSLRFFSVVELHVRDLDGLRILCRGMLLVLHFRLIVV